MGAGLQPANRGVVSSQGPSINPRERTTSLSLDLVRPPTSVITLVSVTVSLPSVYKN